MKIRFTRRATRQLGAVLDHLAPRSPQGSVRVAKRVADVVLILSEHPHIGRQTSRARIRRVALVPFPYVIDYRVDGDEVVVLGIRHTSRAPTP